jgi:hypothetical protein
MPQTTPDYGIAPNQLPGVGYDLAELAARLDSISKYRRTGKVLYQTFFETLDKLFSYTATYVEIVGFSLDSNTSLKFNMPASTQAQFTLLLPTMGISKMGIEVTFALNFVSSNWLDIGIECQRRKDTTLQRAEIHLYPSTDEIKYLNSSENETLLMDYPFRFATAWYNIKFVTDYINNQYTSFIINDSVGFFNSAPIFTDSTPASGDEFLFQVTAVNGTGATRAAWIDSMILTVNEA